MQFSVSWNGSNIASYVAPWTRSLYGQVEISPVEWPRQMVPYAGQGNTMLGLGQPSPRTVSLAVESLRTGTPPADLMWSMLAEQQAVSTIFSPRLGEKALAFTVGADGGSTRTRTLYCVPVGLSPFRQATEASQPGARMSGRVLVPVTLQAAFPWFSQTQSNITGNHTSLSGTTAATGDMPTGWRLVVTAGGSQSNTPAPSLVVTVNGVAMTLAWGEKTTWYGDPPYPVVSSIAWDPGDEAVIEFFYAPGYERLGVVSYIREEGSLTNLRDFGVLVPQLSTMSQAPLIPAGGSSVSVAATNLVSGTTMTLSYVTLHEGY